VATPAFSSNGNGNGNGTGAGEDRHERRGEADERFGATFSKIAAVGLADVSATEQSRRPAGQVAEVGTAPTCNDGRRHLKVRVDLVPDHARQGKRGRDAQAEHGNHPCHSSEDHVP
jgi:hypothetical protein